MQYYDFIGDIHGHADKLELLLQKMDYVLVDGVYQHPERKAFFVGDFIDRGPMIKETLQIVKAMVDAGNALAVMGNHEYNAICFATPDVKHGDYLRKRTYKNMKQHLATIDQLSPAEYEEYIAWFKTLPLFYEGDGFRVVHATWDYDAIEYLKTRLVNNRLQEDFINESADSSNRLYVDIETVLKGKEMELPNGLSFPDKDGNIRYRTRIKWWLGADETNIRNVSMIDLPSLPDDAISADVLGTPYRKDDVPVFFGHYWLKGLPSLFRGNVCCTDFSVAKGGCLVAYRWRGEQRLQNEAFVFI
jgi:hypothetical protein